jgi:hypothetical protein
MIVLVLSLVTNKVIMEGDEGPVATHAEVLEAVEKRSVQMQALVKGIIKVLSTDNFLARIPDLPPVSLHNGKFKKANAKVESSGLSFETLVFGAACLTTGILIGSFSRRSA